LSEYCSDTATTLYDISTCAATLGGARSPFAGTLCDDICQGNFSFLNPGSPRRKSLSGRNLAPDFLRIAPVKIA